MFRARILMLFLAWSAAAAAGPAARAQPTRAPADPGGPEGQSVETAAAAIDAGAVELSPGVQEILDRYNDGIRGALAGIASLRVAQTMFEPQDDGTTKRACATLRYERGRGMVREETFSELVYPVGEYALASLVGPVLDRSEYRIEYAGRAEAEGVPCHLLEVTATSRDHRHFDGSVWISIESFTPVRIVGRVADPPFPAKEVTLDKVFAEESHGLWLVRRHTGRGEFRVLFLAKRGERTIYYDDYEIEFSEPPPGGATE